MRAADVELTRFKNSLDAKNLYLQGIDLLTRSGILGLLRQFARPFSPDRGANPYTSAYLAAHAEGYNQCLDDLMYFDQKYLTEKMKAKEVKADFGGLALAIAKGDLTEKDLEHGKSRKRESQSN